MYCNISQNNFAIYDNFGDFCLYNTVFAQKIAFCAEAVEI